MQLSFDEILDSVEELNTEEKLVIAEIIKNRAIEERRNEIRDSYQKALIDYKSGKLKPQSIEDFMKEITD